MSKKLEKIIEKGENQDLEFKGSLSLKDEIGEAVSAFSNTKGGKILIGISDSRKIKGVQIGKKTIEDLANYIKRNTDPKIYPSIAVKEIDRKKIILVEVQESTQKPVFFKRHTYKRVGKTNLELTSSEIRKLAKESGEKVYWDEKISADAGLGSINKEKVRWFVREARKQRGLKLSGDLLTGKILASLKLTKNGKLTNATLLLFPKETWFLQSRVKCIRFSGNEPVKPYIDFTGLEGTVFDLIEESMNFVMKNIKKAVWTVPGKIQREEKYDYPLDAIREAIVNAVTHRDYETTSNTQVRIFDNRIEIWSPGMLPEGVTIEDLKREHRSVPRNPLLFRQLFWVKYVEDVGGGTLDMIKRCREWGIPEPEFKHITGAFVVTFRLPPSLKELEKMGLNERQIRAVEYVEKKGSITNRKYQDLNNTTKRTATRDLADLARRGIFRSIGEGKRKLRYILVLGQNVPKMSQKMSQKGETGNE